MGDDGADGGAIFEVTVFLRYFNDLPDPRQAVKVVYPLGEVPLLTVLPGLGPLPISPVSGTRNWRSCAGSGHSSMVHRRMIAIGDIFAALDAEHFQHCFVA
jgi:hypothetical protein